MTPGARRPCWAVEQVRTGGTLTVLLLCTWHRCRARPKWPACSWRRGLPLTLKAAAPARRAHRCARLLAGDTPRRSGNCWRMAPIPTSAKIKAQAGRRWTGQTMVPTPTLPKSSGQQERTQQRKLTQFRSQQELSLTFATGPSGDQVGVPELADDGRGVIPARARRVPTLRTRSGRMSAPGGAGTDALASGVAASRRRGCSLGDWWNRL